MKRIVFFGILGSIIIFSFLHCGFSVEASGEQVKEERNVSEFSVISLGVAGNVYLKQESKQKVEIEGDENIVKHIKTVVEGNTLKIRRKEGVYNLNGKVNVYISVPEIEGLAVSGSGDIIAESPIKTNELELKVSGSGEIHINELNARSIESKISGSGNLYLGGANTVEDHEVKISGSGDLKALELPVKSYEIKVSGSGSCKVNALEDLEATISGSGKVQYKGKPRIDAKVSGSGKVSPY